MESRTEWVDGENGARACIGTMIHDGREYSAIGGKVTDDTIAGYPKGSDLLAWDGTVLGRYRVLSSRPAVFFGRRSWQADRQYFARVVTPSGAVYSGRGFGDGMLFRGRRVQGS